MATGVCFQEIIRKLFDCISNVSLVDLKFKLFVVVVVVVVVVVLLLFFDVWLKFYIFLKFLIHIV